MTLFPERRAAILTALIAPAGRVLLTKPAKACSAARAQPAKPVLKIVPDPPTTAPPAEEVPLRISLQHRHTSAAVGRKRAVAAAISTTTAGANAANLHCPEIRSATRIAQSWTRSGAWDQCPKLRYRVDDTTRSVQWPYR